MLKAAKSIFILVILIYGKLYAQEGLQSGRVIDKEKQIPIQGASIVIYKERAVIYRTTTDSVGVFKIPKKLTGQVSIKISSIGYDFIVIALKITISDLGVFELKPHIIILKDVTIRPNKRYRDTTNIDLSNKKFERSKMIDDLLSKEMGFSKDSNGQLYYKGKPVSDIVLNNGDFFGKNNLDIYRLMPALTISNIQITETNVDSLTNVTLLKPVIKVNLVLKDQYKKGIFGNANAGVGSSNRYLANTGLYTYKNNEQISLALNSNNLNTSDNTLINPKINFSPDGNNITTSSAKLTYRNIYANKLEVNFSVKAKSDKKTFNSLSLRQEEDIDQFSKTSNNSSIKSFGISDANFKMNYKIDSLNTITATQKFDHFKTTEIDSLNYIIETDGFNYNSQLKKSKATVTDMWNTDISYLKKFADKKTILNTDFQFNSNTYSIGENDNIYNLSNNGQSGYFLKGSRLAKEYLYILSSNVTEPLNESTFLGLSASFQIDKFNYRTKVISDTLLNNTDPSFDFVSNKVQIGAKFHKTWRKVSFDANTDGNLYTKQSYILKDAQHNFFNIGLDLRAEYEINSKKSLNLNYNQLPNYPGIQELTSLNNSFDLLSQISGNIDLKPEQKKTFKLSYTTRTDGAESISIGAELSHYNSKFGYLLISKPGSVQSMTIQNIGSANSGQITFTASKKILSNQYLSYTGGIAYQESPSILNSDFVLNNGITFNESVSTTIKIIDSSLSVSPIFTHSYSKYFYKLSNVGIVTLTYSDKISYDIKGYQINLFPLLSYNHSVTDNTTFSINCELRKNILKNLGSIWLQGYDILNSFKFYNNNIGISYYQSVKYSNIQRYFVVGVGLKFNNMK